MKNDYLKNRKIVADNIMQLKESKNWDINSFETAEDIETEIKRLETEKQNHIEKDDMPSFYFENIDRYLKQLYEKKNNLLTESFNIDKELKRLKNDKYLTKDNILSFLNEFKTIMKQNGYPLADVENIFDAAGVPDYKELLNDYNRGLSQHARRTGYDVIIPTSKNFKDASTKIINIMHLIIDDVVDFLINETKNISFTEEYRAHTQSVINKEEMNPYTYLLILLGVPGLLIFASKFSKYNKKVISYHTYCQVLLTMINETNYKFNTPLRESRLPSDPNKDPQFGVPEQKKYPLFDKKHVESAIKLFGHVEPMYERQLARAIISKMKVYGIPYDTIGKENKLYRYLPESFKK